MSSRRRPSAPPVRGGGDGPPAAGPAAARRPSDIPRPPDRTRPHGLAEARVHLGRVARASLGTEWLPAFARARLMRMLGFRVGAGACVWAGCSFRSNLAELGEDVFINVGFFFDGADRLTIDDNVRIGQFVRVITATHAIGPSEQRCTIDVSSAPVRIERGCWIGAGVTIMPGVTIARGCVVGAGAVVTRGTEPDGLYFGAPARRIRDLPV